MESKTRNRLIIGGLSILIVLLGYSWFQSSRLLKQERARVSYYYGLFKDVESAKDSLSDRADSIQLVLNKYIYLIDSLQTVVIGNHSQISYLNKELNKALKEIEDVSYNENYLYLQGRYPTIDSLEFPFAGNQVKNITKEVVTLDYTDSLYLAQIDITILKAAQLKYKDEIIKTISNENNDLNLLAQRLHDQMAARLEELQMAEDQLAKTKKALRLWQGGSLGAGAFVVLILLLL